MQRKNDWLNFVLFMLFVMLITIFAALSANAMGKAQVVEAQRIQDQGDSGPAMPPPGVMTKQELVEYVLFLQDQNTKLQDALNICGSYYLPNIMDEVGANFVVFFPVPALEAVTAFLDESGVPAFIVWDKLVDMRLEEGDINLGQEEQGE